MKQLIIIQAFSLVHLFCFCQEASNDLKTINEKKIKLFYNINYKPSKSMMYYPTYFTRENDNNWSYGNISISFEKSTNKWSKCLEIMPISLKNGNIEIMEFSYRLYETMPENYKYFDLTFYFNYQINYNILSSNKRIKPFIGLSTGIYYNRFIIKPEEPNFNLYITKNQNFGIPIELVPGFEMKIKNHFYLEFSFPIIVNDLVFEKTYTDSEFIDSESQNRSSIYGVIFPESFKARIGLNYLID